MGLFDWLGPTSLAKRRGWDALPAPLAEQKAAPLAPRVIAFGGGTTTWTPTALVTVSDDTAAFNSAVAACLTAIASAIAEPELTVYRTGPGERVELENTELGRLLARPNPHMSLDTLLAYTSTALHVAGNAYWRKLRSGSSRSGNVVELWPISPRSIEPYTTPGSSDYVTSYRYTDDAGHVTQIAPANVVHFRYGLDDDDHRLGAAPLKRLLAEVCTDQQATRYADRLLANLAINGLTLSFDKEAPPIDQQAADELKARISSAYGGDNVGATAVLSPGASLTALGFSPEQMDLKVLHRVPEERISAVLGVPAIVAGLGAGLDRATYSNVREAREMFTEAKLIPLWRSLAATITASLVPDFVSDPDVVVDFDTSEVRALAEDQNALALRLKTLVEAGILTEDEARAEIGYEPKPPTAEPAPAVIALGAAASRRGVRALPLAHKAISDIPDRYDELRARSLPDWVIELEFYLEHEARRVGARLRAGATTADELVPAEESDALAAVLEPLQTRLLRDVSRIVGSELAVAFQVDAPLVRAYLDACGVHVVGITDTTRDDVRAALREGHAAGEGVEVLARRLRELPAFDRPRARTVARTELGGSQIEASVASYRASGVVVAVRIHDGDYDAACAARDGTVLTLDEAARAPRLLHPNCTAAWAPVTEAPSQAAAPQAEAAG